MRQYIKYILIRIAASMALIAFSLTMIAWLTQSLRFIDLIVNRGLSIGTFFYLSTLLIPSLLWVILPLSLFISIMFAYNKLSSDSELIILKSAGINRIGLIKPGVYFALFITLFSYFVGLYLLPTSYREFRDTQQFIRHNYASILLQEGVFSNPTPNLTVYIRGRGEDGKLKGLLVHDSRNEEKSVTMMAEEGMLVQSPTGPRFILLNGNRQEINKKGMELSLLHFERYALALDLFGDTSEYQRWRKPKERYLSELFNPDDTTNAKQLAQLNAEGHNRLTWPLYNLLIAMLAMLPFIAGEHNRHGHTRKMIMTVSAAVGVMIWGLTTRNIVTGNIALVPLMYISVLLGIAACYYLMVHKPVSQVPRKGAPT